jgi:hypothetical protein
VTKTGTRPAALEPTVLPLWVRVAGGVLVGIGAVEAAVFEVLYAPLRVGTVLLPVSVLAALVLNWWLPKLMLAATGAPYSPIVPAALWVVVVLGLSLGRPEGDVVLPGNWVGLLLLFGGAGAAAWGVARTLPPRR